MKTSKNNINTGKLLDEFLVKNRITRADLGRDIDRSGLSVLNYIRNSSIQTGILIDICYALKHNFFQDLANSMPKDFAITNDLKSERDLLLAQLQEENKVLKIQNELLMRLKG